MKNINIHNDIDLNYKSFPALLKAFRRGGARGNTDAKNAEFNTFDSPANLYFRILFDFNHGLLDTGYIGDINDDTISYLSGDLDNSGNIKAASAGFEYRNSALSYLMINNEWERADLLCQFIDLLSKINTYSPWYFHELTGVDESLVRSEFTEESFAVPVDKKLTIKCLPDAYDNRIGTLLDLYRSICYSYTLHKEIIPENLRTFTMYLYIFNTSILGMHDDNTTYDQSHIHRNMTNNSIRTTLDDSKLYLTSSKLLQFNYCDFDLNSNSTGYATMNNGEGFQNEYTITINYRNVYEQRYNEVLMRTIGDFILGDKDLEYDKDGNIVSAPIIIKKLEDAQIANKLGGGAVIGSEEQTSDTSNDKKVSDRLHVSLYGESDSKKLEKSWLGQERYDRRGKMFRNIYIPSPMDPWRQIMNKKLNDLPSNTRDLVRQIRKLSYGNLFTTNVYGDPGNIYKSASKIYTNKAVNKINKTLNGWKHATK